MRPAAQEERITFLDNLRGLALLGVLLVNITMLGETTPDAAYLFINITAGAMFYGLFSALFGYGLILFTDRAEERGAAVAPLYMRRMAVLAVIGAGHVALGWYGDILILYAIVGAVAFLFRRAPAPVLFSVALAALVLPTLYQQTVLGLVFITQGAGAFVTNPPTAVNLPTVYVAGSFAEITNQRIIDYVAFQRWPMTIKILGFMLAGMGAARGGMLTRPWAFHKIIRWALPLGLFSGVLFALTLGVHISTWGGWFVADVARLISAPALTLMYTCLVYLAAHRLDWLAPVGRMTLTNYLVQTAVMTFVFYGYGLGLYGSLPTAVGLGLALVIFGLQVPFSHWWLGRYAHGPVEAVWRRLTYGQPAREVVHPDIMGLKMKGYQRLTDGTIRRIRRKNKESAL